MNILFLSLLDFETFTERNIYSDLLREFIKNGHKVFCISPIERRKKQNTHIIRDGDNCILKLKIGNTQKTNLIEKGISTILIEPLFIRGTKRYFPDVRFDLVIYSTPPVTFAKVVRFVKRRDNAKSYLMLKDIFPQNSVDLGMLSTTGLKSIIYKYFRHKEKSLYSVSDRIGCMSQANVDYILKHNREISLDRVDICPNSIEPQDLSLSDEQKRTVRKKYGLPLEKIIFVYGGNLGRPQDVPFVVKCLKACADIDSAYFVISGSGTDRHYLEEYVATEQPKHVKLFDFIPKNEYDAMIACCDIGLIFLDHRFTIPNFPSRLLSYMQAGLPVFACTDANSDVGSIIVDGEFGWHCDSNDATKFASIICKILEYQDATRMKESEWIYLQRNYNTSSVYSMICDANFCRGGTYENS